MNQWGNIFRAVLLILAIGAMVFMAELYIVCKQQKSEINSISGQQKVDAQVNYNKFKYQEEQIEGLSRDLDDAQQQIKDQNDAMLQEIEKRQQIENENKGIQTTLVDIVAEADAIKQDMKGWQKDYATVLAQIEKKMDDSQDEIKGLKDSINLLKADIEKMTPPAPVKDQNADQAQ